MVAKDAHASACRSRTNSPVVHIEQDKTTLDVLCQLLDAATEEFDIADKRGDAFATTEAMMRIRSISAEIDKLVKR